MNFWIVFLRGINVGGQKKFLKASQLKLLNDLNLENPQVYLHTGNWLFQSSESMDILEEKLLKAIKKMQGWEVPILLKKPSEIKTIIATCPFSKDVKEKSYFMLTFQQPSPEKVDEVTKISFPNEEFVITSQCIYMYSSTGYGKSKLNNNFFENKLKITATTRNYYTMKTILNMVNQH